MADMDNVHSYHPIIDDPVSHVTATNSIDLGTEVVFKGERYKYMHNGSDSVISPGDGVRPVTAHSGFSVTASGVTDSVNPCFGVCKNATIATGEYGFILVDGFMTVDVVTATTADFVYLALGADGDFVNHAPLTDAVHIGTYAIAGFASSANTAGGGDVVMRVKV